jgi:exonuclease SbcD
LSELLDPARFGSLEDDFLAITLTDPGQPMGAMDRLRRRFPHVLTLAFAPAGAAAEPVSYRSRVAGQDDLAIATGFVAHVRRSPATPVEVGLLRSALDAARLRDSELVAAPAEQLPDDMVA